MLLAGDVEAPEPAAPDAMVLLGLLATAPLGLVALFPALLFPALLLPVLPLRKSGGASLGSQPVNSIQSPTPPKQALIAGHRNSLRNKGATKKGQASWLTEFPCGG